MINIILLGAPGAGKGTQSAYIMKDFGLIQISTGDILRAAVKNGTALGKLAKQYMDEGKLVPDDVIIGLMRDRLKQDDAKAGFILDGFPRTVAQADALSDMLKNELHTEITHVISLNVPDDVIYERITGRRSCPECGRVYHMLFNPPKNDTRCDDDNTPLVQRSDDTKETLSKRLKIFHDTTRLLEPVYEKSGKLLKLDGTKAPDIIYGKIKSFLQ